MPEYFTFGEDDGSPLPPPDPALDQRAPDGGTRALSITAWTVIALLIVVVAHAVFWR